MSRADDERGLLREMRLLARQRPRFGPDHIDHRVQVIRAGVLRYSPISSF